MLLRKLARSVQLSCHRVATPATTEAAQPSRVRLPRRGGSGTGRRGPGGPSRGLTPLLRLLGAVIVLVALLVVFGLAIQSGAGTSKHDDYSGYMDDVTPLVQRLADRNFPPKFLDLSKFGSDKNYYVPWAQATYVLAVNKKAMQYLPQGADVNALTYDQLDD